MIGRALARTHRAAHEAVRRVRLIPELGRWFRDPVRSATYYPEARRKRPARIAWEQLSWLLRHGEVNKHYGPYGFDVVGWRDQREYLSYREFMHLRDGANGGAWINDRWLDLRSLLRDKLLFGAVLTGLGYPTPPLLGRGADGWVTWSDREAPEPVERLCERPGLDAFCKDAVGECADGVWHLRTVDGRLVVNDGTISADEWRPLLGKRRFVLQAAVRQVPELARLHPSSINTLRLLTVLTAKGPQSLGCLLRFGCGGARVDNSACGGVAVAVDLASGRLEANGFSRPAYRTRTTQHPETHVVYAGYEVPRFHEAVELAYRIHRDVLYAVHSVGWDLAITPEGPTVLEANDNWEIHMLQTPHGGARRRFTALCEEWRTTRQTRSPSAGR